MKTAKQLLNQLIDQYENSVISKEGSQRSIKQRIHFTPKNLSQYFKSDGYRYKKELHDTLFIYQKRKWIQIDYDEQFDEIKTITLLYEQIEEIYHELKRIPRQNKEQAYLKLIEQYDCEELHPYLQDIKERIIHYQPYKALVYDEIDKTKQLFQALKALLQQKEEILERVFSVRVLQNSKAFTPLKSKLTMILKTYYHHDDALDVDEMMSEYNILKHPSHLYIKGKAILRINQTKIYLEDFHDGLSLSSTDVQALEIEDMQAKYVVSIENLTSFYMANDEQAFFVYLGGFHNHIRRHLLIKLYQKIKVPFYHFGDIDAGGFYIYHHLCEKTKIQFLPLYMNISILQQYSSSTLPLSKEDKKRLNDLLKRDSCFKEVILYMLEHNCKLEQENVTYQML